MTQVWKILPPKTAKEHPKNRYMFQAMALILVVSLGTSAFSKWIKGLLVGVKNANAISGFATMGFAALVLVLFLYFISLNTSNLAVYAKEGDKLYCCNFTRDNMTEAIPFNTYLLNLEEGHISEEDFLGEDEESKPFEFTDVLKQSSVETLLINKVLSIKESSKRYVVKARVIQVSNTNLKPFDMHEKTVTFRINKTYHNIDTLMLELAELQNI